MFEIKESYCGLTSIYLHLSLFPFFLSFLFFPFFFLCTAFYPPIMQQAIVAYDCITYFRFSHRQDFQVPATSPEPHVLVRNWITKRRDYPVEVPARLYQDFFSSIFLLRLLNHTYTQSTMPRTAHRAHEIAGRNAILNSKMQNPARVD